VRPTPSLRGWTAASMTHDDAYHWPPELMALLTDTIPLLCRSKDDVLSFLRGAGTSESLLVGYRRQLAADRGAVSKYRIVREVIASLNEQGDQGLGVRRALLRRVTEFEDYSTCWPQRFTATRQDGDAA